MIKEILPFENTATKNKLITELGLENINVSDIEALIKSTKDIMVIDNDSFELAKVEKKKFAKLRNGAVSVFKKAREGFIAAQKFVISEEKEFLAVIAKGEEPLSAQIELWETKIKADQDAKDEAQRFRSVNRINKLTILGAMEDAATKEIILDNVRWSKHVIETSEDESFDIILNEFKEVKDKLDWENDQLAKRKELHNNRLIQIQPFMAFIQLDLDVKLDELSEIDFNKMLDNGACALAKYNEELKSIAAQKAEIKQQVYELRGNKIKGLGYIIGNVAIIGFDKQFNLNILDNDFTSNDIFNSYFDKMKEFSENYELEQKNHKERIAENERRYRIIIDLGFISTGAMFVYESTITLSKLIVETTDDFGKLIETQREQIKIFQKAKLDAKLAADLEAENALSDEEKYNNYLANIVNLKQPLLKSKKYNNRLEKVSDLIFQIKNI